jgi:hypothetical protein
MLPIYHTTQFHAAYAHSPQAIWHPQYRPALAAIVNSGGIQHANPRVVDTPPARKRVREDAERATVNTADANLLALRPRVASRLGDHHRSPDASLPQVN